MESKHKSDLFDVSTPGRASRRSALRDPAFLCLDLYREALGVCLYRLDAASSLRERSRRRLHDAF